jgi:hypothetical protein
VLEEPWRYGVPARRNLYTVVVFFKPPAIDRAPTSPIPHFNGWIERQKIVRIRGG